MAVHPAELFFLFGFYGQGNLGDDLLLRAAIGGIRRIRPNAEFLIRNEGPVRGLEDFGGHTELTGIDRILADQSRSKVYRLFAVLAAYHRHFRRCGWFVFGGGTVFHERTSVVPMLLTTAICLLARAMGLRVVALGVGIADLKSSSARLLLRLIVKLSALFAVRDDAALAECRKAGAAEKVVLTGDLAFSLAADLTAGAHQPSANKKTRCVGVSVYPPALLDGASGAAGLGALREALAILIAMGWKISLLAFHDNPEQQSGRQDKDLLAHLAASLPAGQQSSVSQHVLSTEGNELNRIFADIDVHCGMRFHGHVLASIFGKPFVGISTDNKIDSICSLFGMPVFSVEGLTAGSLADAIEFAVSKKIDIARQESCVAGAERNFTEFTRAMSSTSVVTQPISLQS